MNQSNLKQILKEYQIKRVNAILVSEQKKKDILLSCPELQVIEESIIKASIDMSKAVLFANETRKFADFEKEISELLKKKEELLKKKNILPKELLPIFECNLCEDTGFILQDGVSITCNCLKQKLIDFAYMQSNISNAVTDTFNNFNLSFYSDKANKESYGTDVSPRQNMEFIKKLSLDFVANFDNPRSKNLIFIGNTGLRKNIFV